MKKTTLSAIISVTIMSVLFLSACARLPLETPPATSKTVQPTPTETSTIEQLGLPGASPLQPQFIQEPDLSAFIQAQKDIEKYRKGDVTVIVANARGVPIPGLNVKFNQIEHSFLFGIFATGPHTWETWLMMNEAGLNSAHFVFFSWRNTEPEPGVWHLPPPKGQHFRIRLV